MNDKSKDSLASGILRGVDSAKKAGEAHVDKFARAESKLSDNFGRNDTPGSSDTPVLSVIKPVAKKVHPPREVVVRDTFSFPLEDYAIIEQQQNHALLLARSVSRSEIVRLGLKLVAELPDEKFVEALDKVPKVKTGRPR